MKWFLFIFFFPLALLSQTQFDLAEGYYKEENFGKAKPLFEGYLNKHPKDSKTIEYLGDIAGYAKDWDSALEYFGALVVQDESNANYQFKYGGVLGMKALSVNKLRAAFYISDIKEHFEKAAKLDPNHIETRWALVEFYIQLPSIIGGSEEKAIVYANELASISPVDGYLANGYIAEYNDRPVDAERFYKKAIKVGGSLHTYDKLTSLYESTDQPEKALEIAKECLATYNDRNALHYQIGKITAQYNLDADLGITCLKKYIKNHSVKDGVPKDWAYYRLAQIYKNKGNKTMALSWIDKALQERPSFKEAASEKELIQAL
jgi:tetratricopeptide (TPR) repeat protein